jgi:O-antigen ligase
MGIVRPFWGLCGYLFLVFLQPEWIWRFEGLNRVDFSYQKIIIGSIVIGVMLNLSEGNGLLKHRLFTLSAGTLVFIAWLSSFGSIQSTSSSVYFDVLWKSVLIMVILFHLTDSPKKVTLVFGAMTAGAFYNSFRLHDDYFAVGWCRWIRDSWGYKGDSNVICLFEMPCIAAGIAVFFASRNTYARVLAGISVFLLVHQVFILESRGAMLGLVALGLMLFTMIPKTPKVLLLVFVLSSAVAFVAGPPVVKEFSSIFLSQEERDASAESRFKLWSASLKIALDNPLLGVGPNAGQFAIPGYEPIYSGLAAKHPHNVFFEIASGCGFIALAAFLTLGAVPVLLALRIRRKYRGIRDPDLQLLTLIPIVGMPAIAVTGFFCGGGMVESMYYFSGISLGGLVAYERHLEQMIDEEALSEDSEGEVVDFDVDQEDPELMTV